ncbi:MAG: hypothetical protein K9I94_04415 [Bacteroidales bacterium]|nr:hypothetical protein [Bacteroidales bacterium]
MKAQFATPTTIINWLMEGDPSVKWQVMCDLMDIEPSDYEPVRQSVATQGWGERLLSFRGENGLWDNGLYTPKWTSTTYTMTWLRRLGLSPANKEAVESASILLDKGFYKDGGINYFKSLKHSETCVTGMILGLCSYFNLDDRRIHQLAEHLKDQQMQDGGWNCESYRGAKHSSFHTTISVLGLREYEKRFKDIAPNNMQQKAIEFMLRHHLFRSHRIGEVVDDKMIRLSFPPRWRYDILRMLDYLQEVDFPFDERMAGAIQILKDKQDKNGRWPVQQKYQGKVWFDAERTGKASRMNTLRALRVLKRYQL